MSSETTTTTPTFEFFEGNLSESSAKPQVTVRKGGLMVVTRAAVDMLGDEVSHVQLAFDAKRRAVGIRAATDEAAGAYRLRTQQKSPARLVGGKRFFKHHGLDTDKAATYEVQDFGNGIIGFVLEAESVEAETTEDTVSQPTRRRKTKAA